jgi:hypothetical protein
MAALQKVPGQVLGEKRKEVAAVKRQPKAKPVFLLVRRCAGRAKRTKAAVMAMERVEKVMERGVTEGAIEKMMEAAMVRRERMAPAYRVAVVSDELATRGEVDEPFAGKGGCSTKTDTSRAM